MKRLISSLLLGSIIFTNALDHQIYINTVYAEESDKTEKLVLVSDMDFWFYLKGLLFQSIRGSWHMFMWSCKSVVNITGRSLGAVSELIAGTMSDKLQTCEETTVKNILKKLNATCLSDNRNNITANIECVKKFIADRANN